MSDLFDMTLTAGAVDFIAEAGLNAWLAQTPPDRAQVRDVIAKSLAKTTLSVGETAVLLNATRADAAGGADLAEDVFAAARQLKRDVCGHRIVLFAPLYVGNDCLNDCVYGAFRRSNRAEIRRAARSGRDSPAGRGPGAKGPQAADPGVRRAPALRRELHPRLRPDGVPRERGHGAIRRVNINAAPQSVAGYRRIKQAGIGTFQICQETYHHDTFGRVHPRHTRKGNHAVAVQVAGKNRRAGCGAGPEPVGELEVAVAHDDAGVGSADRAGQIACGKGS